MSKNEDELDHIRIPFEKIRFGNKLEVQGYGTIYEGEFDDQKVALKRLNITNLANIKQTLLNEILTISEFRHHPNLVALLGFCDQKSNEIILVYEYVASGNLADKMRTRLNTIQRLEICLGAARGLEYLHTGVDSTKPGIVHGNIKPSKILLNSNNSKFEAKVSSFGLSKIVPGQASIKSIEDIEKVRKESDVYDFGVLLLEVLCGVSELVDTDDYQERHVTELVPKRMEQDKVRKIVHFDIRKEIKTEALEIYAKIACQCVMENVEMRPTMGQVVEELEKALRLQGGEVTYVQIIRSKNIADAPEEIVVDDCTNDDNNPIIEEDVNDLIADDKLDAAGEDNGNEINIVDATSDYTNGEKNTVEDITTEEQSSYVPVLDSVDGDSVPNLTGTEDAQKERSNNEPETTEGHIDESNLNEKSNIAAENEDNNQNRTFIKNAKKESSNTDSETPEEIIDYSNSNEKSYIVDKTEGNNQNRTHIEDVQKESTNNEPEITEAIIDDSNSNEKSNIIDENEDDKQNRTINIKDAQEESSNNDSEAAEDILGQSDSNNKLNIIVENKDDNQTITHIEDVQKESTNNEPKTSEENIDDLNLNEKSNIAVENEDDNQNRTQTEDAQEESSNNEPETTEDVMDDSNSNIAVRNEDDNQNITLIKDAQEENSNIERETPEEITDDSNSDEKSSIAVEDVGDNQTRTHIEGTQKEISNTVMMTTNGPHTTEDIKEDLNSNEKSNFSGEIKDDNQSTNIASISESSNIDISISDHSTNQEVQNTAILETGSREFNNLPDGNYDKENVDELEHLRIPFEKIKFGKKIDVRGYGSMFKGEFDDQQVALKRLNITNLGNIKPKLLWEILRISKFRQHPNVVALIGFCDEKSNEIILVYEYVSSGNLADKMSKHLTTIQRLEICLGSARGLEYLHTDVDESTPGIIHGDIKLSKILLNSDSSKYEAKVSSYGLSKLLPGDVQIARNSTQESDVYSFGVLLLEVLCGVPELVDTDDYQERHVTELVPKRLEQNMLRKIVHFDIRNEIKTECLETYAKIACRCVMKESEDRPTMAEVVIELEKALRLQGGEVSDIQILGSSNGNGLPKETIDEDDQDVKDNGEKMGLDIAEEEPELKNESIEKTVDNIATIEQSSDISILGGEDFDNVPEIIQIENAEKENGENTEEITVDLKSNEESKINGENEIDQESKIVTSSESNDATKESGNNGPDSKEIMDDKITAMEITMEVQELAILDSDNTKAEKYNTLLNTGKKPEVIVNIREGDFNDFASNGKLPSVEKTQESESKRSNSTCSESSNGDSTTPSDYMLPKSPANDTTVKKTLDGSRNCCSCSWWRYISDRVVFYGGQFWNKLVACFRWIGGQPSSKTD